MSDEARNMLKNKWNFYRHVNDEGKAYSEETFGNMMMKMKDAENLIKEVKLTDEKANAAAEALDKAFAGLFKLCDPESTKVPLWKVGNVPDMTDGEWKSQSPDPETFYPHIVPFLHEDGKTHPAIIVAAGGIRANVKEGFPYCRFFFNKGYNTFLLNHRIGGDQINYGLDIQRAIRLIRYRADEYGIDAGRIAAVGSSMGGVVIITFTELILPGTVPSKYDSKYVPDEIDNTSDKLQAIMGIYTSSSPNKPRPSVVNYSAYPPVFIALGNKDAGLKFQSVYVNDLIQNDVRVELRIFDGAVHGFGLGDGKYQMTGVNENVPEVATWPESAVKWLKYIGF